MKKFSTAPVVALGAALAAGSAGTNADAASLDSVFALIASETGQSNIEADFSFNLNDEDTLVVLDETGGTTAGLPDAGDVITTLFSFESVTSSGPDGTTTVFLDATESGVVSVLPGTFTSTVGVFGIAQFLVTASDDDSLFVTGNPDTAPLFRVFVDDDASASLVLSSLPVPPASTLFAEIGTGFSAGSPFLLEIDSPNLTNANLEGLDILAFLDADGLIASIDSALIQPSNVAITGGTTSANGVVTISAVVVPSPAAAGVGVLGVLGLLGARRRRPTQVA